MEIVETKKTDETEDVKNNVDEASSAQSGVTGGEPLSSTASADRSDAYKLTPLLHETGGSLRENGDVIDLSSAKDKVKITDEDKDRFIDAVIKGTRFTAYAYLYGGRVRVKFRSRTLAETEAVMAYVHREGVAGHLITKSDLSDTILAALFVAQVEEFGDIAYPEMKRPYKFTETASGIDKPGWFDEVEMWKSKPEHITAALGDALVDFEAKYWKMIEESKNENFWKPGGSTGA